MLKAYKPIEHRILGAHKLIEFLVLEVWCKPDENTCESKLNQDLKKLYDNPRSDWFKNSVNEIYAVCKEKLSPPERDDFKNAFLTSNKIKELCADPSKRIQFASLKSDLVKVLKPFFNDLYSKFLSWKDNTDQFGTKKEYYDELITQNGFKACPCCGYGQIKTIYEKGHSAFDHYLPLKHYPFSAVNFGNLIPLCTECNSDNKGEKDILQSGKKVFYPLNQIHPQIDISVEISSLSFAVLIIRTEEKDKLDRGIMEVKFSLGGDEVDSWDSIFKIRKRFFGQIATHRVSWLKQVKKRYDKDKKRGFNHSIETSFDDIIEEDSNEYLGFLKAPFLSKMKSFSSLIEAMAEVSGSSEMN